MTWKFLRDRAGIVPAYHREFGDTFSLRILPGPRTLVVFSDPADVKEIFAADPSQFHAGEGNAILKPVMGEHSVLLTDDAEHQRARKLLMPAFTGPSMRAYQPLVEAIAKVEVDSWHDGDTLVTLDRMNAITLDVILQVVFGVTDEKRLAVLRPKVNRMVNIDAKMLLAWSYPRLFELPPWRGYFKNQQEVDELLYAEIAERRAAHDLEGRDDVLSRLLRVGVLGGRRGREPADRCRDARPARHAAAGRPRDDRFGAVVDAARARPRPRGPRSCRHRRGHGRRRLPRGLPQGVDAPAPDHRLRRSYAAERPGRRGPAAPSGHHGHAVDHAVAQPRGELRRRTPFRPERFTAGKVAANTWIPFGGGVRRCIGAAFSLMEGTVVLREVLQRYEVTADAVAPNKLRNITNVPGDKAPLKLTAR